MAGSRKQKYCTKHAFEGMVCFVSKRSVRDEYSKQSIDGTGSCRKRDYCTEHTFNGTVDVAKQSSCWKPGSKTQNHCSEHSPEGIVVLAPQPRQASAGKRSPAAIIRTVDILQGGGMDDARLSFSAAASDGDIKMEVSVFTLVNRSVSLF